MTIVVGVDGSPGSHPAIRLAWQEARFRNVPLVAVMAYGGESVMGTAPARPVPSVSTQGEQRDITESTLRQVVNAALADDAADVDLRVVQGSPGHGLVQTAKDVDAQMLVLSARSDGAVSRLLGTVSQHVLRSAPCPVLVVPDGR